MKKYASLWVWASIVFLGIIGSVNVPNAFAGDDPVTQLSMSVDAGSAVACTSARLTLGRHAVQPTVAAYVAASNTNDGGIGIVTSIAHVKVPADALYDVWTTNDRPYICCKPAADGSPSTCKVLKYREF